MTQDNYLHRERARRPVKMKKNRGVNNCSSEDGKMGLNGELTNLAARLDLANCQRPVSI